MLEEWEAERDFVLIRISTSWNYSITDKQWKAKVEGHFIVQFFKNLTWFQLNIIIKYILHIIMQSLYWYPIIIDNSEYTHTGFPHVGARKIPYFFQTKNHFFKTISIIIPYISIIIVGCQRLDFRILLFIFDIFPTFYHFL